MDPTVEHRLKFYDRDFVPKEKVCPFSAFGRTNPCTSHATLKSRKDLIQHHLENVRRKGGDSSHPLEDPLWQSDVVQHYWLASRPEKTEDPIVMKIAASKASAKSYQRRKDRQDKEEPALKSKLEEGKIKFEEYIAILVGHKRRKAEAEFKVRQSVQAERELREGLEKEISQLRQQTAQQSTMQTGLESTDTNRLLELTARLVQLEQSKQNIDMLHKQLLRVCVNLIQSWGESKEDVVFNGDGAVSDVMQFPSEVSEEAFYDFASLLYPVNLWDGTPRSGTHRRSMKLTLQVFVQDVQAELDPEAPGVAEYYASTNLLVPNFNNCCELIEQKEQEQVELDTDKAQFWMDEQDRLWADAKERRRRFVRLVQGWRAPIQMATLMDGLLDIVKSLNRENDASEVAQQDAMAALDGD